MGEKETASSQAGLAPEGSTAREAASGLATGKTSAQDDWHQQAREQASGHATGRTSDDGSNIAIGDPGVNGISGPGDAGSGQASGIAIDEPGVQRGMSGPRQTVSGQAGGIAIDEPGVQRTVAAADIDSDRLAD